MNDALCDKLVYGLSDENIQNRLLSEKDLAFPKACEIALAVETATKEAKSLKSRDSQNVLQILGSKVNFQKKKGSSSKPNNSIK